MKRTTYSLTLALLGSALVLAWCGLNSAAFGQAGRAPTVSKAVCVLVSFGENHVTGTIHFAREGSGIHITGEVHGLTPGDHGFHVHEFGDLTDAKTGKSTGGHYNPTHQPHGRPSDVKRHVGDLGNITADKDGVARIDMTDHVIQLHGPYSIIGRGIIIHADSDKFTQPTGDAGSRVAGGVIGIAKAE